MNPLSGAARRRHWLTSIKWHLDDCFRPRTLMRGWIAFVHAVPVECERVGYGTAWQGCANVTEARGCGRSGRPFATGRHLPHLKTNDPRVARGSCTAGNARYGQYADTPGDAQGCGVLLHDPGTGAGVTAPPRTPPPAVPAYKSPRHRCTHRCASSSSTVQSRAGAYEKMGRRDGQRALERAQHAAECHASQFSLRMTSAPCQWHTSAPSWQHVHAA